MMSSTRQIKCTITSGGFSGERTFAIELANGRRWEGTASVRYFRKADGEPLGEYEPRPGEELEGFVECRIVRREGDRFVVEVPTSDLAYVPKDALEV